MSKEAYDALAGVMGPDFMFANDMMIAGGMNAEVIASYGAAHLPPEVYDIFLSAVKYSEETLSERVCANCGFRRGEVSRCPACRSRFQRVATMVGTFGESTSENSANAKA